MFNVNLFIKVYVAPYSFYKTNVILKKTVGLKFIPGPGMSYIDAYNQRLVFTTHLEYSVPLDQFSLWVEPNKEIPKALEQDQTPRDIDQILYDYENYGWHVVVEEG